MEEGVSWLDPSKTKITTIFLEKTNSSRIFFIQIKPNDFLLQSLILINSNPYFWVPCSKQLSLKLNDLIYSKQLSLKLNDLIYSFIASTCANQTKRFYLLNWNQIISLLCQHIHPKEKKILMDLSWKAPRRTRVYCTSLDLIEASGNLFCLEELEWT